MIWNQDGQYYDGLTLKIFCKGKVEMLLSRQSFALVFSQSQDILFFSTFWNGVIPKSLSKIMCDNYLDEELLGNSRAVK